MKKFNLVVGIIALMLPYTSYAQESYTCNALGTHTTVAVITLGENNKAIVQFQKGVAIGKFEANNGLCPSRNCGNKYIKVDAVVPNAAPTAIKFVQASIIQQGVVEFSAVSFDFNNQAAGRITYSMQCNLNH